MHRILVIIFSLIVIPLTMSFIFKQKPKSYGDIAREIRAKTGKQLAEKHQMDLIGVGGGMMGSVYMLGLSFQVSHPLEREEARYLVVDCAEELIAAVNSNQAIRPYLRDYPFTTRNIEVAIFSIYPDGREVKDPYINVASLSESDEVFFRTAEPNGILYKNQYREPYQEALAKVRGSQEGKAHSK